jgi:hypothetical protein
MFDLFMAPSSKVGASTIPGRFTAPVPVECTRAIMQRWGLEWTPAAEQAVSLVAQCHVTRQGQSDTEVSDITWADTAMEALRNAQQRSLLSHGLERLPS